MEKLRELSGQLLCILGQHDFELAGVTFGFGPGGGVRTLVCRRCGAERTHAA